MPCPVSVSVSGWCQPAGLLDLLFTTVSQRSATLKLVTAPHLVEPRRSIVTAGFSQLRYGLLLGVVAIAVALFMTATLNIGHGIYALIVLSLSAVALALWGGPERLVRRVTVTGDGLHIERFHRVRTMIEWSELTAAGARLGQGRRGRVRAELVLTPVDPAVFFYRHPELRAVRVGGSAAVPAGTAAETVTELQAAFDALQPETHRPRPAD